MERVRVHSPLQRGSVRLTVRHRTEPVRAPQRAQELAQGPGHVQRARRQQGQALAQTAHRELEQQLVPPQAGRMGWLLPAQMVPAQARERHRKGQA